MQDLLSSQFYLNELSLVTRHLKDRSLFPPDTHPFLQVQPGRIPFLDGELALRSHKSGPSEG